MKPIIDSSAITRWLASVFVIFLFWKIGDKNWLAIALIVATIFCEVYWYLWRKAVQK